MVGTSAPEKLFFKIKDYPYHTRPIYAVSWNCDGTYLATGSADGTVGIWSVDHKGCPKERPERVLKAHARCDNLSWHPSKREIIATSSRDDKWVGIWDTSTGKLQSKLRTPESSWHLKWRPDGVEVVVCNRGHVLTFVDPKEGRVTRTHECRQEINQMCWSQSMDLFFVTTRSGADVLSYPDMNLVRELHSNTFACYALATDPSDRFLATGGADGTVSLWDINEMCCAVVIAGPSGPVRHMSFAPDSEQLAVTCSDGAVCIASTKTGDMLYEDAIQDLPEGIAWHPKKGTLVFGGGHSRRLRILVPCDEEQAQSKPATQTVSGQPALPSSLQPDQRVLPAAIARALDAPPYEPRGGRLPPRDGPSGREPRDAPPPRDYAGPNPYGPSRMDRSAYPFYGTGARRYEQPYAPPVGPRGMPVQGPGSGHGSYQHYMPPPSRGPGGMYGGPHSRQR